MSMARDQAAATYVAYIRLASVCTVLYCTVLSITHKNPWFSHWGGSKDCCWDSASRFWAVAGKGSKEATAGRSTDELDTPNKVLI